MSLIQRITAAIPVLLAPLLLAACGNPQPLYVDQAWIRLAPNPDSPSAGYFIVHGGPDAVQLRGITTDRALRVEMHESMAKGGMMTMKAIDSVDIPARTKVAFAPGGKHAMLWGINPEAIQQGKLPMTFLFSNGDRIIVDAVIQKAGAATPSDAADHKGH